MKLAILGSTGSIGRQALDIINQSNVSVTGLACGKNIKLMAEQIQKFHPNWVHIGDEVSKMALSQLVDISAISVTCGDDELEVFANEADYDVLITSIVGAKGLLPTIAAIKRGKRIALANKETMVVYGKQIMALARQYSADIIPVDSEHSAIFQSLEGSPAHSVESLILTSSGGPFKGCAKTELRYVLAKDALKHPKWSMGAKISIDSATMMNKGLEVIEARFLFDVHQDNIDVVVHPEAIVHSLVQYHDGSVLAQMGLPDMRLPIHYALHYPDRIKTDLKRLNLADIGQLNFSQPDIHTFPCLKLAYEALNIGGTAPAILNAANEVLVEKYLKNEIGFYDIPKGIENALQKITIKQEYSLDDVLSVDKDTRHLLNS